MKRKIRGIIAILLCVALAVGAVIFRDSLGSPAAAGIFVAAALIIFYTLAALTAEKRD